MIKLRIGTVDGSEIWRQKPPEMVLKPIGSNGSLSLPVAQLVLAGFLNHQQYLGGGFKFQIFFIFIPTWGRFPF